MQSDSNAIDIKDLSEILNGMISGQNDNFAKFTQIYEQSLQQLGITLTILHAELSPKRTRSQLHPAIMIALMQAMSVVVLLLFKPY